MLNHEDQQLIQESSTDSDISLVLVATHGNKNIQGPSPTDTQNSSLPNSAPMSSSQPQFGFSMPSQFGIPMHFGVNSGTSQFPASTSQFLPQISSHFMPMH